MAKLSHLLERIVTVVICKYSSSHHFLFTFLQPFSSPLNMKKKGLGTCQWSAWPLDIVSSFNKNSIYVWNEGIAMVLYEFLYFSMKHSIKHKMYCKLNFTSHPYTLSIVLGNGSLKQSLNGSPLIFFQKKTRRNSTIQVLHLRAVQPRQNFSVSRYSIFSSFFGLARFVAKDEMAL